MRALGSALAALVLLAGASTTSANAAPSPHFTAARLLLLRPEALPRNIRYGGYQVQDSVAAWDGGFKPVMSIDEGFGWFEGARERLVDARRHALSLAVQIFRSAAGARADFGQFFTNEHPETVYLPGAEWLGGTSVSRLGDRATLYRIQDSTNGCPQGLVSGVTFVYANGIFSAEACLKTVGERGTLDLARRLLGRARSVASAHR